MKQESINFSLKDQLFNKKKAEYIAGLIAGIYNDFSEQNFIEEVAGKFPKLELKQRIVHITEMLHKYLPDEYDDALRILLSSLPEIEDNETLDNNFGDFIFSPYSYYVATYGCSQKYFTLSLDALEEMTSRFSCEDAIRYFINAFPDETLGRMIQWSESKNYHIRRLSSEGTRQKLPWCQNIILDYKQPQQILENLYNDQSRYVTRSVANHLNDISKIDGDYVVDVLKRWKAHPQPLPIKEGSGNDLDYIISHSTRTLVKQGHKNTLKFLGYSPEPQITFSNFSLKSAFIKIGEALEFSFNIESTKKQKLIIDYKIYFLNKAGKLSPRVFKIKKGEFSGKHSIQKKHVLKLMTTKALYPGEHAVEIIINGTSFGKKKFELVV